MKKKVLIFLSLLMLSISLVGCGKEVVNTETEEVEVTIVDSYYSPPWNQPIWTGKFFTYVRRPAKYQITIEYDGVEYNIYGSELYETYKNRIGDTVIGILEITYYDDGDISRDFVGLKE